MLLGWFSVYFLVLSGRIYIWCDIYVVNEPVTAWSMLCQTAVSRLFFPHSFPKFVMFGLAMVKYRSWEHVLVAFFYICNCVPQHWFNLFPVTCYCICRHPCYSSFVVIGVRVAGLRHANWSIAFVSMHLWPNVQQPSARQNSGSMFSNSFDSSWSFTTASSWVRSHENSFSILGK